MLRTPVMLNANYSSIEGWASLSANMIFFWGVLAVEVQCCVCGITEEGFGIIC
jgi:hypothetical protein